MFKFKVLKLFRETFGPWVTAAPPRPKPRATFKPRLECLEDRLAPADVSFYWDPTSGNNASTPANWDLGSLGSPQHPIAAPGNAAFETDYIVYDGTAGKGGNVSCTWDYTPTNTLANVFFQNGWTQTLTFLSKQGFSVNDATIGSTVTGASKPTIAAQGGAGAVAAITLTNGSFFYVGSGSALYLTGSSSGGSIFFAGDGTAGDVFQNAGQVIYTGQVGAKGANVDYLKIPVINGWNTGGTFQVNGNYSGTGFGAVLQVSGTDSETNNVSFYQDNSYSQTSISGGGTLWCVNNYTMTAGVLQSTDMYIDILQVGIGGASPVDGSATLTGGNVRIWPNANSFGTLRIDGTTSADEPILNLGSVTLNFNINMAAGSNQCSQLIVGKTGGSGKVNFGYNGGTTTVNTIPQGSTTSGHQWQIIFFGSRTGDVAQTPVTYPKKWNANNLELDN